MPNVYLPNAELKALQDVYRNAEKLDWTAYERAKNRIQHARLDHLPAGEALADGSRNAMSSPRAGRMPPLRSV